MHSFLDNAPEIHSILWRLSQFVTPETAIACARVSRTWSYYFTSPVWHTIDFDIHKRFINLGREVVSKHGHHIRIIKNLKEKPQLAIIQNSSISMLKELHITADVSLESQACCYDILRRNKTRLVNLEILWPKHDRVLFSIDTLTPSMLDNGSKLTRLEIQGLVVTRDAFSSLLRMSPLLTSLTIRDTTLLSKFATVIYQHQGLRSLSASISQVFRPDFLTPNSPSLFAHFPNLTKWKTFNSLTSTLDVPSRDIKSEMSLRCRSLSHIYADMQISPAVDLLSQGNERLTSVRVRQDALSSDLVLAILNHQATLEEISTFKIKGTRTGSTEPFVVIAPPQTTRWAVQMLPRLCVKLRVINMTHQEMDMDEIERGNWVCKDLSKLYIRIRDLDSKDKITRAITLWLKWKSRGVSSVGKLETMSIEERVASHLLKFSKLNKVWLGTAVVTSRHVHHPNKN